MNPTCSGRRPARTSMSSPSPRSRISEAASRGRTTGLRRVESALETSFMTRDNARRPGRAPTTGFCSRFSPCILDGANPGLERSSEVCKAVPLGQSVFEDRITDHGAVRSDCDRVGIAYTPRTRPLAALRRPDLIQESPSRDQVALHIAFQEACETLAM